MTLAQFSQMFALLAVQLRQVDADEATIRGYFEALKDIEPEFLAMAAKQLATSAEWFPKTSEWRAAAAKVAKQRKDEHAAMLRRLPAPLCTACDDTGWARDERDRVSPCSCRTLRQLEILGRRPFPALPPARPEVEAPAMTLDELRAAIRKRTGAAA